MIFGIHSSIFYNFFTCRLRKQSYQTSNFLNYEEFYRKSPSPRKSIILRTRRRWPLFTSGLIAGILFSYYIASERKSESNLRHFTWQSRVYRLLPLRSFSRLWGKVCSRELPTWMRKPLLGLYSYQYGCNLNEAVSSDLLQYSSLVDFFTRELSPSFRPVDKSHPIVVPSDGKIAYLGPVTDGYLEQVKNTRFPIHRFFLKNFEERHDSSSCKIVDKNAANSLKKNKDNQLYQCVIYLSPGDCHRFFAPTEFTVFSRQHYPGYLLSVALRLMKRIPDLLLLNERAVYQGSWKHGFFSMSAVGATSVGSIKIYFDSLLLTNDPISAAAADHDFTSPSLNLVHSSTATVSDKTSSSSVDVITGVSPTHTPSQKKYADWRAKSPNRTKVSPSASKAKHQKRSSSREVKESSDLGKSVDIKISEGIKLKRGDPFGEFRLGSTIVLVFEAPSNFHFCVTPGTKVKYGQPLGYLLAEEDNRNVKS